MPQFDSFATKELALLPSSLVVAVEQAPMAEIGDGPQVAALAERLRDADTQDWSSIPKQRRPLCMSGLWLLAGELDRSHTLSQSIDSPEGSFWHAIMHRREGDFGNSKYWFRRVGEHPVLDQLAQLSESTYADPYQFVDACSRVKDRGSESYQRCQLDQWLEWQALMAYCITH